jgi:hypothetical protein
VCVKMEDNGERQILVPVVTKRGKWVDWLYVILIVGLILFMIWIVFWLQGEGKFCLAQPLNYYQNKTGVICNCFNQNQFAG